MSSSCGTPYPTATLYQTSTTVLPTIVVAVLPPGSVASTEDSSSDSSAVARRDIEARQATATAAATGGTTVTYTSSYTTTVRIPTSTLYATPACSAVSTSEGRSVTVSCSASVRSNTRTQTLTSALATVAAEGGSQSVVYVTYTQTQASPEPVYVTTIAPGPAEASNSSAATVPSQDHTGAVVGGIVGCVGAVAFIGVFIWLALRRRRRRNQISLDDLFQRPSGGVGMGRGGRDGRGADISRNSSGVSKGGMRSSEDEEEEMVQGQIGAGMVPTLARAHTITDAGLGVHDGHPAAHKPRASMPAVWQNQPAVGDNSASQVLAGASEKLSSANGDALHPQPQGELKEAQDGSSPAITTPSSVGASGPNTPPADATIERRPASLFNHSASQSVMAYNTAAPGGIPTTQSWYDPQMMPRATSPPALPHHGSFHGSRYHGSPAHLNRPRSIGDLDGLVAAGGYVSNAIPCSRPTSPILNHHQGHYSPPLRPLSPLTPHHSESMRRPKHRASFGSSQQGMSWTKSNPNGATSTPSRGKGSSPSASQQTEQDRNAFGVQTIRRQTASPPPLPNVSQGWPPSRYSHLDIYNSGNGGQLSTPVIAPVGSASSTSPQVLPRPNASVMQDGRSRSSSGNVRLDEYHRSMAAQAGSRALKVAGPDAQAASRHSTPDLNALTADITTPSNGSNGSNAAAPVARPSIRSVDSSMYWKTPATQQVSATGSDSPSLARPIASRGAAAGVVPSSSSAAVADNHNDDDDDDDEAERRCCNTGRHLFVTNGETVSTPP